MNSKCDRIKVSAGDTLFFNTWGGVGWGDPLGRGAAKVSLDVQRGLVSVEGAGRYGVVLQSNLSVDETATANLRRQMIAERGKVELFNFGGTVEELKARCKADTTLEPPRTPEFQKWVTRSAGEAVG